jgi:eukaryotic-like serine/threonine-protein kinase
MGPPAYRLKGLDLPDGWHVAERLDRSLDATGGTFSVSYIVKNSNGSTGFLKALDFSGAIKSLDPTSALKPLIDAYQFERGLLQECKQRKMDRVVQALADGSVKVDDSDIGVVQYLIFEDGDCDLRARLHLLGEFEVAWKLRSLHHIATGLNQLHSRQIAHQDLKPSNVVVFKGTTSKLADLGCASVKGVGGPRDGKPFAGDPGYAPIEALYGHEEPEWTIRRQGGDFWHLGSMVVFLFTGLTMNGLIQGEIPEPMLPRNWKDSYPDVLPYVQDAFGRSVEIFGQHIKNDKLRNELQVIVRQLCNPTPALRGNPSNNGHGGRLLDIQRYMSKFNLLAELAEAGIFGSRKA